MRDEIKNKIESLRGEFNFLAKQTDDFIFNALASQILFYRNPSTPLSENDLMNIIVDGKGDRGIDCILTDEESDKGDLVLIQCKYHESFSLEDIKAALSKMYNAYICLSRRIYSDFKQGLVSQFASCTSNMQDGAKVQFVIATSAPQKGTKMKSIENFFRELTNRDPSFLLSVYFDNGMADKIIDYDSMRRTVNNGKIKIDQPDNYLSYIENDDEEYFDAVIVNGSAWSIKELYSKHHLALFSQNLRYFIKSKNIDRDVNKSIRETKDKFWYKNNGITIICDDFDIDGREIHLKRFSIINGGQTTHLIGNSDSINEKNDFYLPIKIIKNQGDDDIKKQEFIFDIAIATNSQKAIKASDLKANEPEQIIFGQTLKDKGVFYKTKRGETVPNNYKEKDKNLDLPKASKLGLAGIFLLPGTARSKPSVIFSDDTTYYHDLFEEKEYWEPNALAIKDLLYIEKYFESTFRKEYQNAMSNNKKITFANNSRTLCLAFVGFLSKYLNNMFDINNEKIIANYTYNDENQKNVVSKILRTRSKEGGIFNKKAYEDKTKLENDLYWIFNYLCNYGSMVYDNYGRNEGIDESSWLKKDENFYRLLANMLDQLKVTIKENPGRFEMFKK